MVDQEEILCAGNLDRKTWKDAEEVGTLDGIGTLQHKRLVVFGEKLVFISLLQV